MYRRKCLFIHNKRIINVIWGKSSCLQNWRRSVKKQRERKRVLKFRSLNNMCGPAFALTATFPSENDCIPVGGLTGLGKVQTAWVQNLCIVKLYVYGTVNETSLCSWIWFENCILIYFIMLWDFLNNRHVHGDFLYTIQLHFSVPQTAVHFRV